MACDLRETVRLEAHSVRTRRPLAVYDIRYPDCHQPYDAHLGRDAIGVALVEGVALSLAESANVREARGEVPDTLWIFAGGEAPPERRPTLLLENGSAKDPLAALYSTLTSIGSLQPFGWMEGCVLEALYDLHTAMPADERALSALSAHLDSYFHDGRLCYEDPRGRPTDDRLYGIEATLPYAALARLDPASPRLRHAVSFWRDHSDEEGCIKDVPTTAEGGYTVAYPMAVMATLLDDDYLRRSALRQLELRCDRLCVNDDLYLRLLPDGRRSYRNWARAYAWYLLGLVRTLTALGTGAGTAGLWDEARRVAVLAVSRQGATGLWDCFLGEPDTGTETCGSAGLAVALALGVEQGQFDPAYEGSAAQRAWGVLVKEFLSADGWLSGGSPSNKGGEELQRSGYRVLSGVGTGLMGQLGAALVRQGLLKGWVRS
ncbi:hypothetical protein GCM10010245_87810 [Streptomyces spectabilis]|uniref:Glucuronyl hydrolase n=1 Tax=Streptomyces spectabilis TaxID=68270 RepID=A0A7W8EZT7_STRST|nr:glycoside hydrolase family 88 protein [Streptomyces spectabilis]MBB5109753.1 hypothetical protein [Streptomyces spectabilis]GGV55416.1 hypothetical protein GCM10010245_87810 [Streptomyces spectabilis]